LFDACHSGGVNLERKPASRLNTHLAQLTQTSHNVGIIAASKDDEVSFENSCCCPDGSCECKDETELGDKGHGAFTCALLRGMMGDACDDSKRSVTVESLVKYLKSGVPEMTGQSQHPQTFGKIGPELVVTTLVTHEGVE
jgi:uncharacterized caspase-like protein